MFGDLGPPLFSGIFINNSIFQFRSIQELDRNLKQLHVNLHPASKVSWSCVSSQNRLSTISFDEEFPDFFIQYIKVFVLLFAILNICIDIVTFQAFLLSCSVYILAFFIKLAQVFVIINQSRMHLFKMRVKVDFCLNLVFTLVILESFI